MRFYINFFFLLLLLAGAKETKAQRDTTLQSHTIIVKGKYHYKLPVIEDADFCKELREIKISKGIAFIDTSNGRETSYFLKFILIFKKGNNVPSIAIRKNTSRNRSLEPVITDIIALLKRTKWKVYAGSQGHEIYFDCSMTKQGIKQVILSSNDDLDVNSVFCTTNN